MAWYSSERTDLDTSYREPLIDVPMTSLERALIGKFIGDELSAYLLGKLDPSPWREEVIRKLWRKLHNGQEWAG